VDGWRGRASLQGLGKHNQRHPSARPIRRLPGLSRQAASLSAGSLDEDECRRHAISGVLDFARLNPHAGQGFE